jgi:hypothetical protein
MFKTEAMRSPQGNYNVATSCSNGHTGYKKSGDRNTYKCPYCGLDMP